MLNGDDNDDNGPMGVNLTCFLLGNIDESGNLESDLFDLETQRQLSSCGRAFLKEVIEEKIQDSQESQSQDMRSPNDPEAYFSQTYNEKSPTAEDFFDINETAEDYDADVQEKNDRSLMPPPPLPLTPLAGNQPESAFSDEDEKPKNRGWFFDQVKFLKPAQQQNEFNKEDFEERCEADPKATYWRFGPAQIWYDMLEVPETGYGFDYGFKKGDESIKIQSPKREECIKDKPFPDDAFLMITQQHWEDNVVWDGNDIQHEEITRLKECCWITNSTNRTQGFRQPGQVGTSNIRMPPTPSPRVIRSKKDIIPPQPLRVKPERDNTWYSIFPVENEELVHVNFEDETIWDKDNMKSIPKPSIPTLDPYDENIILSIPDDIDPFKQIVCQPKPVKVKIRHPHVETSKTLLSKAGLINVLEDGTPPPPPKSLDLDPFNISNDMYYQPKAYESALGLNVGVPSLIQHSTPVMELRLPFIKTHMSPTHLRNFHRPPMKRFSHGPLSHPGPHSALPLLKHIKKTAEVREQERMASGGEDVFFMRTAQDVTGKDGNIILIEFCEEHPPLMNQVGMCSKIKNYYKRKAANDWIPPTYKYGETGYANTSLFLGSLLPGQSIQTLENNMYRAPIYNHQVPSTDFLVIRTRQQYYIREIDSLFVAGQECPLYEVPVPNSRTANKFVRDFLRVFIYHLFWTSRDNPRRIKIDDIKRAFPCHLDGTIRSHLRLCADLKRTGTDKWWVIKPEFRLPSEDEMRAMVSPEQCCAYFSMVAAAQRLKDAGYGEKSSLTVAEDAMQLKMDDEVKVAPWNTTSAYIQANKGNCLLEITGQADPTGCGEGFSYVRVPSKPTQKKEEQEMRPKPILEGTNADLRKLSLKNAKAILREFGVPGEAIKTLSRWEVIDVVRTLSTEQAKASEEGLDKVSRGNRFSKTAHQERYREECQRIFDLQNRILASAEVLSTDEGESSEDERDEDIEEMGKNIENVLSGEKTSTQLSFEREEQELQQLKKMMMEGDKHRKENKKEEDESQEQGNQVLKITRTFKNAKGEQYTRLEYVRNPAVIQAYVKIRTAKDESFIRQFSTKDEAPKKEIKRRKRHIQEQLRSTPEMLRRIEGNQDKERLTKSPNVPVKKLATKKNNQKSKSIKPKPNLKVKCGACGEVGHARTNRACPLYQQNIGIVNIDGTKIKFSRKMIKQTEEVKRRSRLKKVPKDDLGKNTKKGLTDLDCSNLSKPLRLANRRCTDPVLVLSSILESILNEMRDMPEAIPFRCPVNQKLVRDYYKVIQRPMDLQTIRENLRHKKYQSREEFLVDVNQILENSMLYNGLQSNYTIDARRLLTRCDALLREKDDILMNLEIAINPLLDNDQVAFTYLLENIMNTKLKAVFKSCLFDKPGDEKNVKDYYTIVKKPMDLETITQKIISHRYYNRQDFQADVEQILENCILCNGKDSPDTKNAELLVQTCKAGLDEFEEPLTALENKLSSKQEKEAHNDDNWMGTDDRRRRLTHGRAASSLKHRISPGTSQDLKGDISLDETSLTPKHPTKRFKAEPATTLEQDLLSFIEEQLEEVPLSEFMNTSETSMFEEESLDVDTDKVKFAEESLDVDTVEVRSNYDSSGFPMSGLASVCEVEDLIQGQIQDDLAVSESEDEEIRDDNHEMQN